MKSATLYSGCLISRRFPGFEKSAKFVCEKLGINLKEKEAFTCCPDPVWARSNNEKLWFLLCARNLSIAEEEKIPLITLCNGCFETLNTVNVLLKRIPKKKEEINKTLSKIKRNYKGSIDVFHLLHYIYKESGIEKIKERIKRPLEGLTFAVHPGCHFMRPSEFANTDNPLAPKILEEMVKATGADVLPYEGITDCCGLPIFVTEKELSLNLAKEKIEKMKSADGIVVICPSCFMQFENAIIMRKIEKKIPIFYYFELLALAFGAGEANLGFETHHIKVEKTLEKIARARFAIGV